MNKPLIGILFVLVLGLFGFEDASAAITVFNDKTTFLIDTGATSATGPLPNLGLIPGDAAASQTVGTVTFTITPPSSELYIGAAGVNPVPGLDWTTINPGPDIAISDIENLNADLSSAVFSLGFDFVEPTTGFGCNNTTCVDSTFSVTLKNGPTTVDSFQFNAPNDVLAFVGVQSDTAFDRVEIREITGNNDDEYFGEFYTSELLPSLSCGPGTKEVNGVCLCEQQNNQCVGGVLLDTDTVSLLAGSIGIDPLLTGLIGITIGGLAVQAVWFVHRRKKK